jgi:bile acid:Na+ symporter, BASS family
VKALARLAGAVLPLALLAAALALLAPWRALADRSELLLAALVALTALGIAPSELTVLRRRWHAVLALSVLPFVVLAPAAWALSRLFDGPLRDGTVALGLAPTEVASAGLVALAMGDAALALAVVAGSLVVSAVAGPLAVSALGGAHAAGLALLGTFALVVLAPLAAGLAVRAALSRIEDVEGEIAGLAALVLAGLVYAALSGAEQGRLGGALLAGGAFVAVSAVVAALWPAALAASDRVTTALTVGLRDFAIAAALAEQAFGAAAAGVPAAYGVLMLLAGSAATTVIRRSSVEQVGPKP